MNRALGEVITSECRTKGARACSALVRRTKTSFGVSVHATRFPQASKKKFISGTTHVDFGFAYDRHAIVVLYRFASCKWDTKMREHGTLRRREKIIRDETNGFDRGVSGKVMTHGQGYGDNLSPMSLSEQGGTTQTKSYLFREKWVKRVRRRNDTSLKIWGVQNAARRREGDRNPQFSGVSLQGHGRIRYVLFGL